MRMLLATLCWACVALAASPVRADPTWVADAEGVSQLVANGATRVLPMPGVRQLAATHDGGAWAMSARQLMRISRDGGELVRIDLAENGYGSGVIMAVDPYDDSAWLGTDAALLLHVSDLGALVHGTSLTGTATALAVSLDQSAWFVASGRLAHVARNGLPSASTAIAPSADTAPIRVAVDSLRDQVWVADAHGLRRAQGAHDTTGEETKSRSGAIKAMALDSRSGHLWMVVDTALVAIDRQATPRLEIEMAELAPDDAVDLQFDHMAESLLLRTAGALVRISREGRTLEATPLAPDWIVAAPPPLRIDPTLALVRPPTGAAIDASSPELMLDLGAHCNGAPCDLPAGYADGLRIIADMNGVPMADPIIDAATGRILVVPRSPIPAGPTRLQVHVVDRFGHGADLTATFTSLARTPSMSAPPATAQPDDPPAALKAPNKAPNVTLTSPVAGATYPAGASVTIAATASDPDGAIGKIEFYRGGSTLIGTAASMPYQFVWQNVAAGSYSLTAKAYDNKNGTATSAPVTITVSNSLPPVVTLTSPAQGAFYARGASIQLAAVASDPDGTIAKVEFLDGAIPIATLTSAPFAATWTGASAGVHSIIARATDDKGGAGISQSIDILVGQPPMVVVKNPIACSSVDGPTDLILAADAMSATGSIARVDFFDGATLVGTSHGAPWYVTLSGAAVGNHSITARAIDDRGLATTSRPSLVTVRPSNQPPTVSLTAPGEGARFTLGSTVNLTANANDADGTVTAVEFRLGGPTGALIGRAAVAPYVATWANAAAGNYTLAAVAFDDRNATTTSVPVHVTIDANIPPAVALTAPAANASYTAPASIPLGANASDSDGSVTTVEFFAGSTLVASSSTAPYTATWNDVAAGTYSLTARATDNRGGVAASSAVSVTVASNVPPTVTLTAAGGPYFAPATIALSANAVDGDGTIAKVEFYASGVLIGSSTASPYTIAWDDVAGASYSVVAVATDNQGAATTSTPITVVVNASAAITLAPELDGSVVDDDTVVVTGAINAPANSGVLVNGIVAQLDAGGHFYVNGVPLALGANSLIITLVSANGQVVAQTLNVASSGAAPFSVVASPTDGFAPLGVTFQIANRANAAFERLEVDFDGNGTSDYTVPATQFSEGTLTLLTTYPAGTFASRATFYDAGDAVIQSTIRIITARTLQQQDDLLRGVYDGMLANLRAGRTTAALNAITGDLHDKYSAVFTALGTDLPAVIESLGTLQPNWYASDHAEYFIVRDTPDGQQAFLIDFIRGQDGVWRIHGM